ncbi:hypothetical protein CEXT_647801 [Caerostris extrusa]|uniref:Uncharacterized protein n=1 Tax=Caerostris extrusa TaxID=172846 RepID=A0AAV4T329_CAEEX|nr:hypothetical protein CEXT_647801 [Caerostris extrusa]
MNSPSHIVEIVNRRVLREKLNLMVNGTCQNVFSSVGMGRLVKLVIQTQHFVPSAWKSTLRVGVCEKYAKPRLRMLLCFTNKCTFHAPLVQ